MTIIKPLIFGSLVLAALSVTQMDAFARGHEGPRPEHFEHQPVPHNTINNPGARSSGPASTQTQVSRHKGPEVVIPGGVSQEIVVPGGATVGALPESKTETTCTHNPSCIQ